jgi:hypothetical protein
MSGRKPPGDKPKPGHGLSSRAPEESSSQCAAATAYLDESFGRGIYTITAVIVQRRRHSRLREQLRALQLGGSSTPHAYHLSSTDRDTLIRFYRTQPDLRAIVAVQAPYVAGSGTQEAARFRCLTECARRVAAEGVQWMIMDSRDRLVRGSPVTRAESAQNTRDQRTLKAAKSAGVVPVNMQLTFRGDQDEILLALPDIVGWLTHASLASGRAERMAPLIGRTRLVEGATILDRVPQAETSRPRVRRKGRPATHPQPAPTPPPNGLPTNASSEPTAASPQPPSHTAHTRSTGLSSELAYHLAAAEAHWLASAHRHIRADIAGIYAQAGTADEATLRTLEQIRARLVRDEPRVRHAAYIAQKHARMILNRIHHPAILPSVIHARQQLEQLGEPDVDHDPSSKTPGLQSPYLDL